MRDALRLRIGGGYKIGLEIECLRDIRSSYDPEELLPEDAVLPCSLCRSLGVAYRAKVAKENKEVFRAFSEVVRETKGISDEEATMWVVCFQNNLERCGGCPDSPEYILDEIEEIKNGEIVHNNYRPPVVVGHVGSSFFSPGS